MNRLTLLGFILLLAACGVPQSSTPAPTPQAIDLTYSPALQPWADKLAGCASNNPLVALYVNQTDTIDTGMHANDIVLELDQTNPSGGAGYRSQVGREQIDVIVNQNNPISELSTTELRSIFSGQQPTWNDASAQPIQVWVLPAGDPARMIFDQIVLQTQPLTTQAMLAPDHAAMLEAISKDVNSIGYLPASFLHSSGSVNPGKVDLVQLDLPLETALDQPVVALTQAEPQGLLRSLLVCLEAETP
jgi:phosphate transport system substrate-binding protein